jgi:hypothetical protein
MIEDECMTNAIRSRIILILLPMMLLACAIVETSIDPQTIPVELVPKSEGNYTVHVYNGGEYARVEPVKDNFYRIDIPGMHGGYRKFLFFKYKKHDPLHYKIILVKRGDVNVRELSVADIKGGQLVNDFYQIIL